MNEESTGVRYRVKEEISEGEKHTYSQTEGMQALVRDNLKTLGRERITDGRCLKLIIPLVGIFITSWGMGKKELKSIAKRVRLIRRRDISFSEKGGGLHKHAFGCRLFVVAES